MTRHLYESEEFVLCCSWVLAMRSWSQQQLIELRALLRLGRCFQ